MDLFPGERHYLSWLNKGLSIKAIHSDPLLSPWSWNACLSQEKEEWTRQQKQEGPFLFLEASLRLKMQKEMPTWVLQGKKTQWWFSACVDLLIHLFIRTFIQSFIIHSTHQPFIEHILGDKHCARYWTFRGKDWDLVLCLEVREFCVCMCACVLT